MVGIYISGYPLDEYKVDIKSFCTGSLEYVNNLENYKNQEFTLAGIITMAEHRFTRKGDPFGTITIEDYNDTARINLFNHDYGKYKDFMIEDAFVFITGKIEPKRWNPQDFEFSIKRMDFLSNIREQMASGIEIKMPIKEVNHQNIDLLNDMFEASPGKFQVKFMVVDELNKLEVEMPSRALKVDITHGMIELLENMDLDYKLYN